MKSGTVPRENPWKAGCDVKELHIRGAHVNTTAGQYFILPHQAENVTTVSVLNCLLGDTGLFRFVVLLLCSAVVLCPVISETQGGGGYHSSYPGSWDSPH